ncbi:hypothetical protein [Actinomadura atramentaria]|uniref:hypothetical protein n=1 Tax=Actinomadura atramentaria TaxID=1990 RepID=UPI00037791EC|nr:hypothetical protein [Actinomadura atramentaria]
MTENTTGPVDGGADEADAAEQRADLAGAEPDWPGGVPAEADEADAAEQRADARDVGPRPDGLPAEADEADVAEQEREVPGDEDEYR